MTNSFTQNHLLDKHYDLMTDDELNQVAPGSIVIFDIECYRNFFLIAFKFMDCDKFVLFEQSEYSTIQNERLLWIMKRFVLVGFNSINYDIPMIEYFLYRKTCAELKAASDFIIFNNVWTFRKTYFIENGEWDHIDLFNVCPGFGSLKLYAARLNHDLLQDLPVDPSANLTREQQQILRVYCCLGDLRGTELVLKKLIPEIQLRYSMSNQYDVDLRSKSDAQIAETVIKSELKKHNIYPRKIELPPGTSIKYKPPEYIQFQTHQLRDALEHIKNASFTLDKGGSPKWPDDLGEQRKGTKGRAIYIKIGTSEYKMGIGGLHSMEKSRTVVADENHILSDHDVASYYPSIILNQSLFPTQLTNNFLTVYRNIVESRLDAKKRAKQPGGESYKTIADSLKITINGSFGKFGSKYSVLYSPKLLLQVTLTGQLSLLMLIEMLDLENINVVSANTDGIVCHYEKRFENKVMEIVKHWESVTNFETEKTEYKMLLSRDVNSYVAIKKDGEMKLKGSFNSKLNDIQHNQAAQISVDAALAFVNGTPIETTVRKCSDFRKFISVKNVRGGGEKNGTYLGKVVRWYYALNADGPIRYVSNGHSVGKSEGAQPTMDLPVLMPDDINYDWYINESLSILMSCGYFDQHVTEC